MDNDQIILAVDDKGNFLEYIPKELGHLGGGMRHLAITVLVKNKKGEVLLQKRKHKIFDSIWDISGATHPLHDQKTGEDESLDEATQRCLNDEWRINGKEIKDFGAFNYFAKDGESSENEQALFCENEHCHIMVAGYDGEVKLNPNAGYEYKWLKKEDFLKDIEENPEKYSVWSKEAIKILKKKGFFN